MARRVLCLMNNETTQISNCDDNTVPFSTESCNTQSCVEDEVTPIDASHDIREDEDEEDCEDSEEDTSDEDDVTGPTSPIIPPSWMSELLVNLTLQNEQKTHLIPVIIAVVLSSNFRSNV